MIAKNFYITTTLPYVNASPHIGFALEIVAADVIARYQRQLGRNVVFNTGTDEHGQKIYEKAIEENIDPQAYCNQYAEKFSELKDLLGLSFTNFIRTTDAHHVAAAQEFWRRCYKNGDIYKRDYEISYCVGCELEKQASELVEGRCPLHSMQELEIRQEENYFFRFSKYQQELLNLYENDKEFVKPEGKLKEIISFVNAGINDFSISRLKSKMPWGISVPNDEDHVMYVWFDALVNYISTLGWPNDLENFTQFWPGMQVAGKDNLRQQAAMWQAMLISADLPTSKQILINGFINVGGQKMSKSLGNVISPKEMVEKYGIDATRYLLINLGPFSEDMDVTWEKLDQTYTSDLANGLGNLCSRVAKMCQKFGVEGLTSDREKKSNPELQAFIQKKDESGQQETWPTHFHQLISNYELSTSLNLIMNNQNHDLHHNNIQSVALLDKELSTSQPWLQEADQAKETLNNIVKHLVVLAEKLTPFMPETSSFIFNHFTQKEIVAIKPLFPRL